VNGVPKIACFNLTGAETSTVVGLARIAWAGEKQQGATDSLQLFELRR
jgi:hypothetical protein